MLLDPLAHTASTELFPTGFVLVYRCQQGSTILFQVIGYLLLYWLRILLSRGTEFISIPMCLLMYISNPALEKYFSQTINLSLLYFYSIIILLINDNCRCL